MREILFKAKRIDNGEWVEGFYCKRKTGHYDNIGFHDEYKNCIIVEFSDGGITWCDVNQSTICQYTGLTDKNGQKIWENDIVRHEDLTNGRYIARKQPMKNSVIKWNCKEVKFERSDRRDIYKPESRLEVIGNIFDNPELLNE